MCFVAISWICSSVNMTPRYSAMTRTSSLVLVASAALFSTTCASPRTAPAPARSSPNSYDVIVANGRIVDGTGNPWFYGDVGLVGDRVARIAPAGALANASAKQRVDARGLVVAPGFIDIQSHSWDALLWRDGRVVGKVTQGVTTEILGEATTPAPVNDEMMKLL